MGGGHSPDFLVSLRALQRDGRFPLEKLVEFHDFADTNRAMDDRATVKPVVRRG
jgi:aryl-alcohol dehydrogenase